MGSRVEDPSRGGLKSREELNRENEVLRDRVSGLSAALLRISGAQGPAGTPLTTRAWARRLWGLAMRTAKNSSAA